MDNTPEEPLLKLSDLKEIYGQGEKTVKLVDALKEKLNGWIVAGNWEFTDIVEHDYSFAPVVACVIYYVTGYLCRQIMKHSKCHVCSAAFVAPVHYSQQLAAQLVNMKSRGKLIHPNMKFFEFIRSVEYCFAQYCDQADVYERTVDAMLDNISLDFPCDIHKEEVVSFSVRYYLNMRMRQWSRQSNREAMKHNRLKKKAARFCKT